MPKGEFSVKGLVFVFGTLLVLLAATVGASYVDLGPLNVLVALLIAGTKAALIIAYFMHVKFRSRLVWAFALMGFFWLAILMALTLADVLTREELPQPEGE